MKAKKNNKCKRRHIRFLSEQNTLASIGFQGEPKEFAPELVGLVVNESFSGCCLLMVCHSLVQEDVECLIQCGDTQPIKAHIKWVMELDESSIKVGIEFRDV